MAHHGHAVGLLFLLAVGCSHPAPFGAAEGAPTNESGVVPSGDAPESVPDGDFVVTRVSLIQSVENSIFPRKTLP